MISFRSLYHDTSAVKRDVIPDNASVFMMMTVLVRFTGLVQWPGSGLIPRGHPTSFDGATLTSLLGVFHGTVMFSSYLPPSSIWLGGGDPVRL